MKNQALITKRGKTYSIQLWIDDLKSWLVFDNFKTKKLAKEFLEDKKEMAEVKRFIKKRKNEVKDKTVVGKHLVPRKKVQNKKV
jgi:hypothetical protein